MRHGIQEPIRRIMLENCENFEKKKKVNTETQKFYLKKHEKREVN